MTHTPGPWIVSKDWPTTLILGQEHVVAKALYWSGSENAGEPEANAALIARAPELQAESARRLALLMRVNEWANETGQCPICRSVSWDGDALMHVPDCALDAECNG